MRRSSAKAVKIDLNQPMDNVRAELTKYPVSTRVSLNGTIIVAATSPMPNQSAPRCRQSRCPIISRNIPCSTPDRPRHRQVAVRFHGTDHSQPHGPLRGPEFQSNGGSMIMIAKGNRTQVVTDACKKHGGFYLGSIGGPAAVLSRTTSRASNAWNIPNWAWKPSGKSP
jgi:fumarate hydratase class I